MFNKELNFYSYITASKYKEKPIWHEEYNAWNEKPTRRSQQQTEWYRGIDQQAEREIEKTKAQLKKRRTKRKEHNVKDL